MEEKRSLRFELRFYKLEKHVNIMINVLIRTASKLEITDPERKEKYKLVECFGEMRRHLISPFLKHQCDGREKRWTTITGLGDRYVVCRRRGIDSSVTLRNQHDIQTSRKFSQNGRSENLLPQC